MRLSSILIVVGKVDDTGGVAEVPSFFLWSVVQYTSYTMSFFKTTKILTTLIKFSFHTLKCVEVQTKELLNSRISEVES